MLNISNIEFHNLNILNTCEKVLLVAPFNLMG